MKESSKGGRHQSIHGNKGPADQVAPTGEVVPRVKGSHHRSHHHGKKGQDTSTNPFAAGGGKHRKKGTRVDSYAQALKQRTREELKELKNEKEEKERNVEKGKHNLARTRNWSMSPEVSQVSDIESSSLGRKKFKAEGGEQANKIHGGRDSSGRGPRNSSFVPPEPPLPPFYLQSRYSPTWGPGTAQDGAEADKGAGDGDGAPQEPKDAPNFGVTGKLMEDTNKVKGVIVNYNEPAEARIPKKRWRLYPFKAGEPLPVLHIHRQSAFMCGRDRRISEIPLDHPSCSKQHAVIQFRSVPLVANPKGRDDEFGRSEAEGSGKKVIKPYVIDLGSGNGTFLNNNKLEPQRYYELMERDVLKFGFSSREYVLLHEHSGTEPEFDEGGTGGELSEAEDLVEGE